MTDLQVENCQEHLCIDLEHDGGYSSSWRKSTDGTEVDESIGSIVLVLNGTEDMAVDGMRTCYLTIDESYPWNLSPGQLKAYELLLSMQKGSTYSITTIKKLADAMGLEIMHAAYKRLENLQSLGVISGLGLS
ncbi:MAG: hypothetical protein AAFR24_06735 [Cyanobacteria bacterium J06627_3]